MILVMAAHMWMIIVMAVDMCYVTCNGSISGMILVMVIHKWYDTCNGYP